MLCRVFHKAKTENSNQLSPQDVFEVHDAAPYDTSPLSNRNLPLAYFHHQQHNQITPQLSPPLQNPNNLLQFPTLNPNYRQISHQAQTDTSTTLARVNDIMMMNSKCDDQSSYKFLLDMNFEEGHMGDGLDSNMRFDDCL